METIKLKSFLFAILFVPFCLIAQNKEVQMEGPAAELEVNGIIFSSRGGIKFPDGTIQTTAYLNTGGTMMEKDLSALVVEFSPTSGIIGPA
jgi:hypothetical protein